VRGAVVSEGIQALKGKVFEEHRILGRAWLLLVRSRGSTLGFNLLLSHFASRLLLAPQIV